MSTITYSDIGSERTLDEKRGFFMRILDGMIAAREAQAKRYVARYFLSMDDETIENAGFTREELLKIIQ